MEIDEFEHAVADPATRTRDYAELVVAYYDLVDEIYRAQWGSLQHLPVFVNGSGDHQDACRTMERRLADAGGYVRGMNVLDLGCGIGGPALTIAGYSEAHVTGVDISPPRIEQARARAVAEGLVDRTTFVVHDVMDLPFEDDSFDAAHTFDALCHAPDKAVAYTEVARVLAPGGVLLGYDWFQGEGVTDEDRERFVDPICECHMVPYLPTLAEQEADLVQAGFVVDDLFDAVARARSARTWELFDFLQSIDPDELPPLLRMMARGGRALGGGGRAGAFVIGFWRARLH